MAIDSGNSPTGETSPALARAIRQLLRPLVALLIDHGLTYSWLIKNLKPLFVEVAENDFKLEGKRQTDSRICLLTGLDRKDIRKLRGETDGGLVVPANTFIGAQLVSIWMTEKRFLDKNGIPAPLTRLHSSTESSNKPSFEELFALVTKSIKPRAFLDEWVRIGAVTINENDEVCIELDAFITNKGFEDKVFYLGKNIHDHLAASRQNILSDDPPFLERGIYYDKLSEESVEKLSVFSKEKGMEMLKSINQKARRLQLKDAKLQKSNQRMHLGVYFFSDDDE